MLRTTFGCTWPEPATSSQRPQRAAGRDVDLGTGLGEREEAGAEAQHQVVGLEEKVRQKSVNTTSGP
jgi:hypothetical protein